MIAPSTTTPATTRTPRSSLSDGAGDGWVGVSVLTERGYVGPPTGVTRLSSAPGVGFVTGGVQVRRRRSRPRRGDARLRPWVHRSDVGGRVRSTSRAWPWTRSARSATPSAISRRSAARSWARSPRGRTWSRPPSPPSTTCGSTAVPGRAGRRSRASSRRATAGFGLSPDALLEQRPTLVVGSLSAWGERGPWGNRAGFDSIVQAATGIAEVYGSPAEPGALPVQALDHATGYLLAARVISLLGRNRGGVVRASLLGAARTLLLGPRSSGEQEAELPVATVRMRSPYGAARPSWR